MNVQQPERDSAHREAVPWNRYWCRRGEQAETEHDFLVEPRTNARFGPKQNAQLATLSELMHIPCLVLLGDPGMGKSFELRAVESRVQATVRSDGEQVVLFDLKSYTERTVERLVLESPQVQGWSRGEHELTLILDSLDECWRRVESLGPLLAEGLFLIRPRGDKSPRLKLRLGCRGAEWRPEIEEMLAKIFPAKTNDEASVQVWFLAALTRNQAFEYATAHSVNGTAFMAAIDEREVTALGAHPITLNMLVETFRGGGVLGRTRAEVYESGLLRLCRDSHSATGMNGFSMPAGTRLAVAARIAAVGVLSNRYLVDGDFDSLPDPASSATFATELIGHFSELRAGESIACTHESMGETLRCGLFESQTGKLRSWRHQSYAEYLAARYLNELQPPIDDVVALLCDRSSGRPRIHVQLEETACWLAGLWAELFMALVPENADVFFRCDPARLSAAQRAELVAHFFQQLLRNDAEIPHWGDRARLARLDHLGLAAQLTPILEDTNANWMLRDAALDIARACQVKGLERIALERLVDPHEVLAVRSAAGMLLRDDLGADLRGELKRRLAPEILVGAEEVRGHCLFLLWPEYLTVTELVALLVPDGRKHVYGIYQDFCAHLPEKIRTEDLPALLTLARERVEAGANNYDREQLPERIAEAALSHLRSPIVHVPFVELLQICAKCYRPILGRGKSAPLAEPAVRRDLWRLLIESSFSVTEGLHAAGLWEAGLQNGEDMAWLVAQAEAATTDVERQAWCHAIFQLFNFEEMEHVEYVWPAVERFPEFKAYWLARCASQLPADDQENWPKRNHYRKIKDQEALAERQARTKPLEVQVEEALLAFADGKIGAIWWLDQRLSGPVVPDRDDAGGFSRQSLDEGAAWKALSPKTQERVLDAACSFLAQYPVEPAQVCDREQFYFPYSTGARFMCVLHTRRFHWLDERTRNFWEKWALVLIAYRQRAGESNDERWGKLIRLAFARAREGFFVALRSFFPLRRDDTAIDACLTTLDELPSAADVDSLILQRACDSRQEAWQARRLFGWLLARRDEAAESFLRSILEIGSPESRDRLSPIAAGLLLAMRAEAYGDKIICGFSNDRSWGTRVLAAALNTHERENSWMRLIPPASCVKLWEWLSEHHPGDPYRDGHDGSVGLEHNLYHLRSGLLTEVAARGTPESVAALACLMRRKCDPWIGQILARARRAQRRLDWKPPASAEVMGYLARRKKPPLSTAADLAEAIVASLRRYEATLHGKTPVTELWNGPAGPVRHWSPREEETLSNCLARHLETDLKNYRVSAVRESETRERLGDDPADWPDLVVTAPSASSPSDVLTVIVEVKAAWNAKIPASMASQLVERYLRAATCGIYLVGWFSCGAWDAPSDGRRLRGWCARSITELQRALDIEAARLAEDTAKWIRGVVLDARLG